jgi:hypothetical protein
LRQYNQSDIIIQQDKTRRTSEANSGFFLVKPTKAGIELFEKVVKMTPRKNPTGDQVYVNRALGEMKRNHQIQEKRLDPRLFPLGRDFFTTGHRMFIGDNPCEQCVIVHNNYIVSIEAKRYRFMEYGLWEVDEDGYYSNQDRRYIQFDNPVDFSKHSMNTRAMELKSLKFALTLGYILNRIVILPRFHCAGAAGYGGLPGQLCHFGAFFCVRKFESVLPMLSTYRENVFLRHPLVPEAIKTSKSKTFVIDSELWRTVTNETSRETNVTVMKPSASSGVSPSQLREWFSTEPHHVLVFQSLYNDITEADEGVQAFVAKLNKSIKKSDFMQLKQ